MSLLRRRGINIGWLLQIVVSICDGNNDGSHKGTLMRILCGVVGDGT